MTVIFLVRAPLLLVVKVHTFKNNTCFYQIYNTKAVRNFKVLTLTFPHAPEKSGQGQCCARFIMISEGLMI